MFKALALAVALEGLYDETRRQLAAAGQLGLTREQFVQLKAQLLVPFPSIAEMVTAGIPFTFLMQKAPSAHNVPIQIAHG